MRVIAFIIVVQLVFGCTQKQVNPNLPIVSSGEIERIDSFPSKFISARNVDVWLPENYSKRKEYAVLYMHDGQMLFDSTKTWNKQEWAVDEIASIVQQKGKTRNFIVVAVWNISEERHSDYFPQKPFEYLAEKLKDSLLYQAKRYGENKLFSKDLSADNYLKFLVKELKPFIDKTYATKTGKDDTFIMGSSMGGLISMYALCEYPEVFGGAACLSTHWIGTFSDENNPIPDAFIAYLEKHSPDPKMHKLYFDYGTETLDRFYEPYQLKVDSVLELKGWDESYKSLKFEGHDHSENAWKSRLHIPLEFLFAE